MSEPRGEGQGILSSTDLATIDARKRESIRGEKKKN